MNTLSWLIYIAGVTGTLGNFLIFIASVLGVIGVIFFIAAAIQLDETDSQSRPLDPDKLTERRKSRGYCWRYFWWGFMGMWIVGGIAAIMPSRQTVLLIAASEIGEQVVNHQRIIGVLDPSIELLQTWIQQQTASIRQEMNPPRQGR